MKRVKKINEQRIRRARRTRARIKGTTERPRLSLFRSNTGISVQLIDDTRGITIVSARDKKGVARAAQLGKKIAETAQKAGIAKAVFDRGAYRYHGNVKAVAESAREAGLQL